ncbi:hypothetical protein HY621_03130 [Candidatus Uhrbacteria bacterium]|nr:hypothetical protein [Candidatus Uhrbacteria bacterium]
MKHIIRVACGIGIGIFCIVMGTSVYSEAVSSERIGLEPTYKGTPDITVQPGTKDFPLWYVGLYNAGDTKKTVEVWGFTLGNIPIGITDLSINKTKAVFDRSKKEARFTFSTPFRLGAGRTNINILGTLSSALPDLPDRFEPTFVKAYRKDGTEIAVDEFSYLYEIKIQRFRTVTMYGDLQQAKNRILLEGVKDQFVGPLEWEGGSSDTILNSVEFSVEPADAIDAFEDIIVRDDAGKGIKTTFEKKSSSIVIRFATPLSLASRTYLGPGTLQRVDIVAAVKSALPATLSNRTVTLTIQRIEAKGASSGIPYQLGSPQRLAKIGFAVSTAAPPDFSFNAEELMTVPAQPYSEFTIRTGKHLLLAYAIAGNAAECVKANTVDDSAWTGSWKVNPAERETMSSSAEIRPLKSGVYTLACKNAGGVETKKQFAVTVLPRIQTAIPTPPRVKPQILKFEPGNDEGKPYLIAPTPLSLRWQAQNATHCAIWVGTGHSSISLSGDLGPSDSFTHTPYNPQFNDNRLAYNLKCYNGSIESDTASMVLIPNPRAAAPTYTIELPQNEKKPEPKPEQTVCATDVNKCSDGTFVSRDPNNDCMFKSCPAPKPQPPSIPTQLQFRVSPTEPGIGFTEYEISWQGIAGAASECEASSNTGIWEGSRGQSGKEKIQPYTDTQLSLSCMVGATRIKETREIIVAPTATLFSDRLPVQALGTQTTKEIPFTKGEILTVEWASGNASYCELIASPLDKKFEDTAWTAQKGVAGRETISVEHSTKYTLTCVNPLREHGAKTVSDSFTVIVSQVSILSEKETSISEEQAKKEETKKSEEAPHAALAPSKSSAPAGGGGGGGAPAGGGGGPVSAPPTIIPTAPASAGPGKDDAKVEKGSVSSGSVSVPPKVNNALPQKSGDTQAQTKSLIPQQVIPPVFIAPLVLPDISLIVPSKKVTVVPLQSQEVLQKAQEAGLDLTTLIRGKEVKPSVAQQVVVANILAATSTIPFEEKVEAIGLAKFFIGGKLPETKKDAEKVLTLMANKPLMEKEISSTALTQIRAYESAFCPKNTCKGNKDFNAYLRGEPISQVTKPDQEKKAIAMFKKSVGRAPRLDDPFEAIVVHALSATDLTKVSKKQSKLKAAKKLKSKK